MRHRFIDVDVAKAGQRLHAKHGEPLEMVPVAAAGKLDGQVRSVVALQFAHPAWTKHQCELETALINPPPLLNMAKI